MTLEEVRQSNRDCLTAVDIAPIVGAGPVTIRAWARECPEKLGFPVIVLGSRVRIPRLAFLRFFEGER